MSQTSATPGRVAQPQSSNPGFYRAMGEEIDRLTSELERAHAQEARSRLSAQEWQTRAEDAEQRAEETKHRVEETKHRAEEAERELSRIHSSLAEFNNAWRDMGQAFANVTGQNQDLNPAGQGERQAHFRRSGSDQDTVMAGDGTTPVSDHPPMRETRGPSQNSGNPLPNDPNALSRLGPNLHYESSSRSSFQQAERLEKVIRTSSSRSRRSVLAATTTATPHTSTRISATAAFVRHNNRSQRPQCGSESWHWWGDGPY